jgi:hypothetical protein
MSKRETTTMPVIGGQITIKNSDYYDMKPFCNDGNRPLLAALKLTAFGLGIVCSAFGIGAIMGPIFKINTINFTLSIMACMPLGKLLDKIDPGFTHTVYDVYRFAYDFAKTKLFNNTQEKLDSESLEEIDLPALGENFQTDE